MKKSIIIIASVLALMALVLVPFSAMAAPQTSAVTTTSPVQRVHLAIVQPWVVNVGQSMQLTVFERLNQTQVSGASVWTISKDKEDTVKQAIKELLAKGAANVKEKDFEDLLNANGTLLGQTDINGRLTHTFNVPADYVLVALKDGFLPGFSCIAIREALAISAPKQAAPGDKVTISVDQKSTTLPVSGAKVWAIDFSKAQDLKHKVSQIRTANQNNLQNADWDSTLGGLATLLGTTDANGQVIHSFEKGKYLLVTTLKGAVPAYTAIVITAPATTPPPTTTTTSTH